MNNGHKEILTFPVSITCPECKGDGAIWRFNSEDEDFYLIDCPTCEGTGKIEEDPNQDEE